MADGMARIQFILKAREVAYVGEGIKPKEMLSSGLLNSATFVADMLKSLGHDVQLVHAENNNCCDRLVTLFKPDVVIIEAYWVVPEKFEILSKLHPKVTWIVRNHSALPFLASEGIGMDWSLRYMDYPNVILACNDARVDQEMRDVISVYHPEWSEETLTKRVVLLPNFYPVGFKSRIKPVGDTINISCFGAMRPLKNHLAQAVAAIQYAKRHKKHLRFHVNSTRIEMKGEPIVHNLQKMFKLLDYELVEHEWLPHADFCNLLREMDVAMQVSYTETFNIVTADAIVNGVPIITSSDIVWSDPHFQADPNSTVSMVEALEKTVIAIKQNNYWQRSIEGLLEFSNLSQDIWTKYLETIGN